MTRRCSVEQLDRPTINRRLGNRLTQETKQIKFYLEKSSFSLFRTVFFLSLIMFVGVFFTDTETAQNALRLVHGFRLLGKPLVVEFGRERVEEKQKQQK